MTEMEKESSINDISQIAKEENSQDREIQKIQEFNQVIFEDLFKIQDYNEIAKRGEKYKSQFRAYKKLKWKGIMYQINESIRVNFKDCSKIGIIKRIISIKSFQDNSELPLLQLNWYYIKHQLNEKWDKYKKSFSDYELFLTETSDYIFVGQLIDKVKVLSLNEYDSFLDDDISGQNKIFFMRCTYNVEKNQINPDPNELDKVCQCEMPQNPDLVYIFCEQCKKWFHMDCVHLTEEEAKNIEEYVCIKCHQ